MIGIKAVLLLSLSFLVFVSGCPGVGDRDRDAYPETSPKRLLDLEARSKNEFSRVDDLAAKRSASGISVDNGVTTAYNEMKDKRMYSWIICKIDGTWKNIVLESKATGTFDEFEAALKSSGEPRYAVYDTPAEWGQASKLVYISWIPDDINLKLKMLYQNSEDAVLKTFKGLVVKPVKVTDRNDSIKDEIMDALS